jgi:hypothetical protein
MPFSMPTNPSTDNYTVPGGIRLYFNDGAGMRDLGNIASIDMEPGSDMLEHFSNLSGKRMKDKKLVIEEKLTFNVTLDEPNAKNMNLFFRGGVPAPGVAGEAVKFAIAAVGAIEGAARLEVQPSTGRGHKFNVVFGKASIMAKGALSFDDKDWMKIPLVLEVLDNSVNDPSYPFGYYEGYGVGTSTANTTTTTTSTSTTTTT